MTLIDRSAFVEELSTIVEAIINDRLDRAAFGRIEPREAKDLAHWLEGASEGVDIAARADGRLHLTRPQGGIGILVGLRAQA